MLCFKFHVFHCLFHVLFCLLNFHVFVFVNFTFLCLLWWICDTHFIEKQMFVFETRNSWNTSPLFIFCLPLSLYARFLCYLTHTEVIRISHISLYNATNVSLKCYDIYNNSDQRLYLVINLVLRWDVVTMFEH